MHRPGHVEEGLVDRDALDQRSEVLEHSHDHVPQSLVLAEVAADENQPRAQSLGPPSGHAGVHPEPTRLIGGSENHALTDGHRPAPQRGVQELLGRGIEGIEIGMEDRGTAGPVHGQQPTRTYVRERTGRSASTPARAWA